MEPPPFSALLAPGTRRRWNHVALEFGNGQCSVVFGDPPRLDGSSVTGADGSGHRSASSTSARVVKCARHTKPLAHVEPA